MYLDFKLIRHDLTDNPFVFHIFAEPIDGFIEKQRYDGWYNNLAHPEWGSIGKT